MLPPRRKHAACHITSNGSRRPGAHRQVSAGVSDALHSDYFLACGGQRPQAALHKPSLLSDGQ